MLLMAKALTMLKTTDLRYGNLRFGKLGAFLNAGGLAGLWYHSNHFHRGNFYRSEFLTRKGLIATILGNGGRMLFLNEKDSEFNIWKR